MSEASQTHKVIREPTVRNHKRFLALRKHEWKLTGKLVYEPITAGSLYGDEMANEVVSQMISAVNKCEKCLMTASIAVGMTEYPSGSQSRFFHRQSLPLNSCPG